MKKWQNEVEQKLKRKNKILFNRQSDCLQDLIHLIENQKHRTLVLWAFDCMNEAITTIETHYPNETRPSEALKKCQQWSQGKIKMPEAKKALLSVHAIAKEITDPVDQALCHAIGQGLATVHVETHAIGFAFYELTSIVLKEGLENCEKSVEDRIQYYEDTLHHYEHTVHLDSGPWALFLLDDSRPNKEKLLNLKKEETSCHK